MSQPLLRVPNEAPIAAKMLCAALWQQFFNACARLLAALPGVNVAHSVVQLTAINTPYGVATTDESIFVDATSGPVTVLLPSGLSSRIFTVKKIDASGNAVTVNGNGHNIDAAATTVLAAQWNAVVVQGGSSQWFKVGGV